MVKLVLRVAVYALAIWLAVRVIDGLSFEGSAWELVGIALILAVVNAVVRPVLKVLSFPFILVTLGAFLLVINAIMLWLTVWISGQLEIPFDSTGFGATFLGALVITIVVWIGEAVTDRD